MKNIILFLICIGISNQENFINPDLNDEDVSKYCSGENFTFYNHTPFSYIINETTLCSENVFLLTYVQSSSINFERRQLIRDTWGSLKQINSETTRLLFIIGRPSSQTDQDKIMNESKKFRDLVQADFRDTYKNLTLKHMVALHWIHNFCPQAEFISKTDDDTFINIFSLTYFSRINLNPKEKFILGQISSNEHPIRKKGFKWTVGEDMYSPEKYPPYTKGFAYMISQAAVRPLLVCSYYEKYLFIDDVFITGIVLQRTYVHHVNFQLNFGYIFLDKENITANAMDYIYIVGRNIVLPTQWEKLWDLSLKQLL